MHHLAFSSPLPRLLVRFSADRDSLQDLLPILIQLHLRDLDFAGRNADRDALAVALLAGDTLDVDDVLEAVDGGDLAFAAFVAATLDDYLVVLADGNCADLVISVSQ